MKLIIDNNNSHYDMGDYEFVFDFNTKVFPFLKRYSLKYDFIEYDFDDPSFILVRDKKTGREYYQELNDYTHKDLKDFFNSLEY